MKKSLFLLLICLMLLTSACIGWGFYENTLLTVTTVTLRDQAIPEAFEGFRIAHISDLHSALFGQDNRRLLDTLAAQQPDLIAFTGDMVDSRNPRREQTLAFLSEAVTIAPCVYVTGNHESSLSDREAYLSRVEQLGVEVLRGEALPIRRGQSQISILGVDDYSFFSGGSGQERFDQTVAALEDLDRSGYDIALYHRPELAAELTELDIEVFLSGHAHGGQFRLPVLGALIAPDQGLFPRLSEGVHSLGGATVIISRGLGNSLFPFRLNNPPEVVMVVLSQDT